MIIELNGMRKHVPDQASISELRQSNPELQGDQLLLETQQGTRELKDTDRLKSGDSLVSIPPVIKG